MSLIQTPWTSQPQQVTGVKRDAFPGRPLVYASRVSDGCYDQVGNRPPVAVSASRPTTSVSSAGIAGEFVPANSQYYSITTATNLVSGSTLTVACWARIDSITGGVIYSLNGTGYSAILGCLTNAYLVNQTSAANTNVVTGATTGLQHIVCVHRSNTYSLYVDGVLRSQTAAGNYFGQPVAGNHSIGSRLNGSSPQYFDGAIQDLYVFQGELTEAEAKSLYRNHWQIFQPIPRRIFVPVSSGTGDGTGTCSLYGVTLSSPSATASGTANATASGSVSTIALTAPNGSASAGTSATASGSLSAVTTSAPSASATGSALATGSLSTVTLSTVAGTATGTTAGSAVGTGAIDSIQIDAPTAIAIASSVATGGFQSIGLTAPLGTASAVDSQSGTAIAALQYIYLVAPTGTASDGTYASAPIGAGPTVISSRQSRPSQSSMSRPSVKSGGRP